MTDKGLVGAFEELVNKFYTKLFVECVKLISDSETMV